MPQRTAVQTTRKKSATASQVRISGQFQPACVRLRIGYFGRLATQIMAATSSSAVVFGCITAESRPWR